MRRILNCSAMLLLWVVGCSPGLDEQTIGEPTTLTYSVESPTPDTKSETTPENVDSAYPGLTIDQVFPSQYQTSFVEDSVHRDDMVSEIAKYTIRWKHYVPRSLERAGRKVFSFPRRDTSGYWASLAGISRLRGAAFKEIYVAVSGPGGVCCTNYSIVDISTESARIIYHSEDFGRFRNPMEIFDADGDGIYELVQFDSCLRYFQDDCGSCSPEPRVYFKYRNDLGKYWPVKNVMQDFVREGLLRSDKWITEKYEEWKGSKDLGLRLDLHRSIIAHASDLLHIGEADRAWKLFQRFPGPVDRDDRLQLLREIRKCGVYKALYSD